MTTTVPQEPFLYPEKIQFHAPLWVYMGYQHQHRTYSYIAIHNWCIDALWTNEVHSKLTPKEHCSQIWEEESSQWALCLHLALLGCKGYLVTIVYKLNNKYLILVSFTPEIGWFSSSGKYDHKCNTIALSSQPKDSIPYFPTNRRDEH